jgi:hypothetical protein
MRLPKSLQKIQLLAPEVQAASVDSPVGGWDAISPLAKMEPKYAVVLDNWVPRTAYVELRKGYQPWCQGLAGSPVETLMTYRPDNAPEALFAACGGKIWNVSSKGVPTVVLSGLSSNRWQYINFTPANGANYLYAVNGVDNPIMWNGTTWASPPITVGTASTFNNIYVHKRRIWFVQAQSTVAWYLATDAIQGAATKLDVGALMTKGGYLVASGTWTIDGGLGPDDYAVFASSRGELVIYKGTNPSDATAWSLVGVFDFPPPLSSRCFCRMGSDLWIITTQGVIPVSQGLPFDPAGSRSAAITSRIQNAMRKSGLAGQNMFGWQMLSYPNEALAILNVPIAENSSQQQFVTNLLTGAWCRFTGWNANHFEIFNDLLYFGDNTGNVNIAYTGVVDLMNPITADLKCAFNYFGDPGRLKRMTMAEPLMVTSGAIIPTLSVDVDFADSSPSAPINSITPLGAIYDTSVYDLGLYAAGNAALVAWQSIEAQGRALALRMNVNVLPTGTNNQSVFDTGVFDTMVFDGLSSTDATLQLNAFNVLVEFGANV